MALGLFELTFQVPVSVSLRGRCSLMCGLCYSASSSAPFAPGVVTLTLNPGGQLGAWPPGGLGCVGGFIKTGVRTVAVDDL